MKKTSHNHFEQFTVEEESRAFLSGLKTAAYGIDRDAVYRKACQKAGIQPKKRRRVWQKWAFLAACALLVVFTGVGVFSAFPAAQHKLAQFLHLSPEGTQYIGITSSSNGYTMKVVSGRLCKDNAVVLVTFEKDDGTAFQGNWSPDFSLFLDDGSQMPFSGFSDGLYS